MMLAWPTGRDLIAAERRRQVEVEGWSEQHDREHGPTQLASAGHAYWRNDSGYWPWNPSWWKPKSQFRNLVRAGALYTAARDITESDAVIGRGYYEGLIHYVAEDLDALIAEVAAARRALAASDGDGRCQDCGCGYGPWFADNGVWNFVMGGPDATDDPGGCVCPRCFMERAATAGESGVWRLTRDLAPSDPATDTIPGALVEKAAQVVADHRWKSMGVSSVTCECGELLYGDESLTQFPADEAFREHLTRAVLDAVLPDIDNDHAEQLRMAVEDTRTRVAAVIEEHASGPGSMHNDDFRDGLLAAARIAREAWRTTHERD